jgi:co-chaperonin GroES (HSP10)
MVICKIGDSVLYGKYAGSELKFEGSDYLIMRRRYFLQYNSFNRYKPTSKL